VVAAAAAAAEETATSPYAIPKRERATFNVAFSVFKSRH